MLIPAISHLTPCLCQCPSVSLGHFRSLLVFKGHKAIDTESRCSWGSPVEPKLWLGVQTYLGMSVELMGQGPKSPFPGVAEAFSAPEHVCGEGAKQSELQLGTKTKSWERRGPSVSSPVSPGPCLILLGVGKGWKRRTKMERSCGWELKYVSDFQIPHITTTYMLSPLQEKIKLSTKVQATENLTRSAFER